MFKFFTGSVCGGVAESGQNRVQVSDEIQATVVDHVTIISCLLEWMHKALSESEHDGIYWQNIL